MREERDEGGEGWEREERGVVRRGRSEWYM